MAPTGSASRGRRTSGASAIGVRGGSVPGSGVVGASTNGVGVKGTSTNAKGVVGSGKTVGVEGTATATGVGVSGRRTSARRRSVSAAARSRAPASWAAPRTGGRVGHSAASSGGRGVYGLATGGGVGAYGESRGNGSAVYGYATADGFGYGVTGLSTRSSGVIGSSLVSSGFAAGVYGSGNSPGGAGIYGSNTYGGTGVWAPHLRRLGAVRGGELCRGPTGSVCRLLRRQDARRRNVLIVQQVVPDRPPAGPANRTLAHSSVEAPEMLNVYRGTVTLNASGRATVRLPRYFQALNRDYAYQLTALDAAAPGLHVARRIERNSFVIAGGAAGQEVCWQVTGARQDAWAKANPLRVERRKRPKDRGRYLNPEVFGEPRASGIDRHATPKRLRATRDPTGGPGRVGTILRPAGSRLPGDLPSGSHTGCVMIAPNRRSGPPPRCQTDRAHDHPAASTYAAHATGRPVGAGSRRGGCPGLRAAPRAPHRRQPGPPRRARGPGNPGARVSSPVVGELRVYPHALRDNLVLDDDAAALDDLRAYRALGGTTLVELTPRGMGRDLARLRRFAAVSGVTIISGTGWYVQRGHGDLVAGRSRDDLADQLVADLTAHPAAHPAAAGVIGEIGINTTCPTRRASWTPRSAA